MKLISYDRERFGKLANILAILLAASLPWSTSATSILAVLWLIAALPTVDPVALRRMIITPSGGLPLLLVALGAAGMLWAEVTWPERFNGLSSFYKFLFIPLLLHYFSRLGNARNVLIGFAVSCTLLLLLSWVVLVWPDILKTGRPTSGVPVKDYISQGAMFTICMAIVLYFALDMWRAGRRGLALALIVLAIVFVANVFFIATSRTSLVVAPVLLAALGYRQFGWKGTAAAGVAFLLLLAAAWPSSGPLRVRLQTFVTEIRSFEPDGPATPAGERLVFWIKSVGFIQNAPVVGHGTGSIHDQFKRSTIGRTGMAAEDSANPHNQMLAVGIQLGGVGIAVLLAMWLAHLLLFNVSGMAGWVGLVVVIQNVVGSQFNSHLFDFTHGWLYVVGVGIAGGAVLKQREERRAERP